MSTGFADRLAAELTEGWWVKARPNQLPPDGEWSIWLLLAGRGFGKTRVLSEMVNHWATTGQCSRIALVAATAADATEDKMMSLGGQKNVACEDRIMSLAGQNDVAVPPGFLYSDITF